MYHPSMKLLAVIANDVLRATAAISAAILSPAPFRSAPSVALMLAVLAAALPTLTATAAPTPMSVMVRPDSDVTIKVDQLFKDLPPMGFAPIRVYIKNKTAYTQTWTMSTDHRASGYGNQDNRSIRGVFSFSVESGREGQYLVLAPLLPRADASQIYYGGNPNLRVSMS